MKQQTSASKGNPSKGNEIFDFSGKTIYVGIDVHLKDWQVATVCGDITLGNFRMTSGSPGLIRHLKTRYPGAHISCVYESCAWGFRLYRELTAVGIDCIVVHPGDVIGSNKEQKRKSDKVDAAKLARQLAAGLLKGIYVPDEELQQHRSQVRLRDTLKKDLNRSKNRLKGLFKLHGIDIPPAYSGNCWSKNFMSWVEQEAGRNPLLKEVILIMLEEVRMLRQLLLRAEKMVRELMKTQAYEKQAALATSVPGIGPVVGGLFVIEIGDIHRFSSFDKLNDYVGLCPDSHSSGETNRHTGITSRSHRVLRKSLVQAAWVVIRKDPAMLDSYQQLCKRMPKNQAIIRIARKLLRRLRAVLVSGIPYQSGLV